MQDVVFYLAHRFDVRYFSALRRKSRFLRSRATICLLIDPSQSLALSVCDEEILRADFDAKSVVRLPGHVSSGPWRHRLQWNYRRMLEARAFVDQQNRAEAIFVLNNKASSIGHMICGTANRAILIQQEGDIRVPGAYRLSIPRTVRANLWNPRVGGRLKRVYVSKSSPELQHHRTSYPNVRVGYDTAKADVPNRIYVGSSDRLYEPSAPVIWFGSRCMEWTYFDASGIHRLRESITRLAERHTGKTVHYKPRRDGEAGEIDLLRKHWRGPVSILDWRPSAESIVDAGLWSASYSIGSTASIHTRSAGIPTQVIYRSLGFPSDVQAHYDTIFTSMPQSFFYKASGSWPPTDQVWLPSYTDWLDSVLAGLQSPQT